MALHLYDNALLQKLKYWTEKTEIDVYGVDDARRLFEVIADKTDDNSLKLPIIALRRPSGFTILNTNKKPLSYDGLHLDNQLTLKAKELKAKLSSKQISLSEYTKQYNEIKEAVKTTQMATLNAIPISIAYKLDVYTRYQKENDLYMRNLIFNIINYPNLQVNFSYEGIPIEHMTNIRLQDTVNVESSEVGLYADHICKQSLDIYIDDAYLWDTRLRNAISLNSESVIKVFNEPESAYVGKQPVEGEDYIIEHI